MEFDELISNIDLHSPFHKMLEKNKLTITQNELLKYVDDNHFTIIHKRRQEGVSTALSVYILWLLINNPGHSIALIFSQTEEREKFRQIINMNLTLLEKIFKLHGYDMVLTAKNHNINETIFPNGSRIHYWSKNNKHAGRGHSLDFVYISEVTHQDNYMELIQCLYPCVAMSKKGRFLITSSTIRTLKEDFFMNGEGISEYWCNDFFDGKRFVIVEKYEFNHKV